MGKVISSFNAAGCATFLSIACSQNALATEPSITVSPMATPTSAAPVLLSQSEESDEPSSNGNGDGRTNFVPRDLFVGVGIGLTYNLGGSRTSNATVADISADVEGDDTVLFVQEKEDDDTDIRILFETHYLLKDQSFFVSNPIDGFSSLVACGPFALVTKGDQNRRGCGPFVAAAIDSDGEIQEFGIGWMLGLGRPDPNADRNERHSGFGLGVGVMIDPDSSTIDGRVVDLDTFRVKSDFVSAVQNEMVGVTTEEATVSALIFVTRDF
ncbi:MAG: hypothetical protein AAGA39_08870 [Pseudomonadota bacterium]